jgi:HlyD family secretion protein
MIMGYTNAVRVWTRSAIVFLLGSTVLSFSGCSDTRQSATNGDNQVVPAVEALQARLGSLPLVERLTGVVRARNQVAIYPEVNAVIAEVLIKNGQVVERGQPLVRLRDKEFRERLKQLTAGYQIATAQAKQADAALGEARAERRRAESMAGEKLISDADLETARTRAVSAEAALELALARVEQARANLDEQEVLLSQTVVTAPVAGTVGDRDAEVGMLASSGKRLFTLGQLDSVRVEVVLTDRMLEYVKPGQRVEIFTDNITMNRLNAKLSRISPFLHPVAHTTAGEIDIANPGGRLRPGMFVGVDLYYGESEKATLVPLSALYENPTTGGVGLFVSDASLEADPSEGTPEVDPRSLTEPVTFKFVPVKVLAKGRMHAGIAGVEPGQWIVTVGQDLLTGQSGQARVRIVDWDHVERLQQLERQELLEDVMKRQQAKREAASSAGVGNQPSE